MADASINIRDDETHEMFPIILFDLGDGTYLGDLTPFMVMRANSYEAASVSIGEEITAEKSRGFHRSAEITISEDVTAEMLGKTYHRYASIEIGQEVTAKRRIAFTRKAVVQIGEAVKMFVIIPAPGIKTFIFNRTYKFLEFINNLLSR